MYSTYNKETQERTYYDASGNVIETIKQNRSEPVESWAIQTTDWVYDEKQGKLVQAGNKIPWTPILIGVGAVALIWIIAS